MTLMTRRRMRPWLGTYVTVEAGMATEAEALRVIEAAFARVAEVHLAMSFHSADSEIARLHREAAHRPTPVGEHTWSVLALTLRLAALSDGVFDPTVAASLVRHGALPRPDGPAPHPRATWRDIELAAAPVDHVAPDREFARQCQKACTHAFLEVGSEILEPLFGAITTLGPGKAHDRIHVDDEGEIGLPPDHHGMELVDGCPQVAA